MFRSVLVRLRAPCLVVGLAFVLTSWLHHDIWVSGLGALLLLVSVAVMFVPGRRVRRDPIEVQSPVRGRWIAVNSPASKVPSHGVHSAGQTYAIDLLHWPDEHRDWKPIHRRPLTSRPSEFPAFGQPIYAPVDGTVVRARDWWRDHRSRNSVPALLYFYLEGTVRELASSSALLGNHLIIDMGDGTFAALAHLKRRSIAVTKGQRVHAGQQLAECGNSGNTTEPHLHFQLMDRAAVALAAGLPFTLAGHETPKNGDALVVP